MPHYITPKAAGMERNYAGHWQHPTRWTVKILSGAQTGMVQTFASAEAARIEAFTMSDMYDTCTSIYPPLYTED